MYNGEKQPIKVASESVRRIIQEHEGSEIHVKIQTMPRKFKGTTTISSVKTRKK